MGLDQFGVKGGRPKKETEKKEKSSEISNSETTTSVSSDGQPVRLKYYLSCTKSCGFKRVLRKVQLKEDDYICTKCKKKMKVIKKE